MKCSIAAISSGTFVVGAATSLLRRSYCVQTYVIAYNEDMSNLVPKSWKVLSSHENEYADRCVDVFARPDGTYGFEEYRRDAEDMGAWTPVAHYSARSFPTREEAWSQATHSVAWLAEW